MAYIFNLTGLVPASVSGYVGIDSATFRHPLTPFWWRPASAGSKRGIALNGADFHDQNTHSYATDDDYPDAPAVECGNASYRTKVTTYEWEGASCTAYVSGEQTFVIGYDFATSGSAAPTITYDPPITPGPPFEGLPGITTPIARSSTTASVYEGPIVDGSCTLTSYDSTLSDLVDATWLLGEIGSWDGSTDVSNNTSHSMHTESDEGWRCRVSFFEYRPQGYWFSGTPSGMTGDLGTLWNGNFSTYVIKDTRKNYPRLWKTSQLTSGGDAVSPDVGSGSAVEGKDLYKEGYYEEELSDDVTGKLVDQWGIFDFGGDDNWDTSLEGAPFAPISLTGSPASDNSLLTGYCEGEVSGTANELVILSASARRFRITLAIVVGDGGFPAADLVILTMEEGETRVSYQFPPEYQSQTMRVETVERWNETTEEWFVIAECATYEEWLATTYALYLEDYTAWEIEWQAWFDGGEIGEEPIPPEEPFFYGEFAGDSIGTSPLQGLPLFSLFRFRSGEQFGFYDLDGGTDRYATRTFRKHLEPGTVSTTNTGCGGTTLTGNLDLEYVEDYIDGELRDPRVTQWQAVINGVDWTPEDWDEFDSLPGSGETTQTATLRRWEITGTWDYLFEVAFDWPSSNGKLISTTATKIGMTISGSTNIGTDFVDIETADPGYATFSPGHRLVPE